MMCRHVLRSTLVVLAMGGCLTALPLSAYAATTSPQLLPGLLHGLLPGLPPIPLPTAIPLHLPLPTSIPLPLPTVQPVPNLSPFVNGVPVLGGVVSPPSTQVPPPGPVPGVPGPDPGVPGAPGVATGATSSQLNPSGADGRAGPGGSSGQAGVGGNGSPGRKPQALLTHGGADTLSRAADASVFPLLLLALLGGFLMVQRWIDRGDPKLAASAVGAEPDLSFE